MIKSLFEPDASQPENAAPVGNEIAENPASEIAAADPQYVEVNEAEQLFESSLPAADVPDADRLTDEKVFELFARIENEPEVDRHFSPEPSESLGGEIAGADQPPPGISPDANFRPDADFFTEPQNESAEIKSSVRDVNETPDFQFSDAGKIGEPKKDDAYQLFQPPPRESFAETARQSGLAYAAAITLFASVIFMLIIGWFADLLFGSSPWGKVAGIAVGSLIGFIQLFRISSQIFKKED